MPVISDEFVAGLRSNTRAYERDGGTAQCVITVDLQEDAVLVQLQTI